MKILKELKDRLLMKKDKRGIFGLNYVSEVFVAFIGLVVLAVVALLVLYSLLATPIFTAGSLGANQSATIINNATTGMTSFFSITPTVFAILGVVVIILIILIIIFAVKMLGGGGSKAGGMIG